jgi:hypothetical protein
MLSSRKTSQTPLVSRRTPRHRPLPVHRCATYVHVWRSCCLLSSQTPQLTTTPRRTARMRRSSNAVLVFARSCEVVEPLAKYILNNRKLSLIRHKKGSNLRRLVVSFLCTGQVLPQWTPVMHNTPHQYLFLPQTDQTRLWKPHIASSNYAVGHMQPTIPLSVFLCPFYPHC